MDFFLDMIGYVFANPGKSLFAVLAVIVVLGAVGGFFAIAL